MLKTNIFPSICSFSPGAPQWFFELSNGLLMTQKVMAGFLVLHTGKSAFIDMYRCPLDFYDVLKQFVNSMKTAVRILQYSTGARL